MPFSPEGQYERSPHIEQVHHLIEEFRDQLETQDYKVNPKTDAVMALSGPSERNENGEYIVTTENTARIEYAVDVVKDVAAKRLGKEIDQLTTDDIVQHGPDLILNGEEEQLPSMKEIAERYHMPTERLRLVPCGHVGEANTRSHFLALNEIPAFDAIQHMTLVSSSYHAPRVARVALANSPTDRSFDVIGAPTDRFQYNVYRKVRGEVKRILEYADNGFFELERSDRAKT